MNSHPEPQIFPRWIPVSEALPDDKEWVLVWHTGYGTPKKARFKMDAIDSFLLDGGGGAIEIDGWSSNSGRITHWMHLPGPPDDQ